MLTGGAAKLTCARELAGRMLAKQGRVGQPVRLTGLADAKGGPAFSTCAGLLTYSQISPLEAAGADDGAESAMPRGQFRRFGRWLKENF